eukprot:scaffold55803_cov63-Phaeocystis_antarctica.AAC.1
MPIAERLAQPLQRLAAQRLSGGEVALVLQQHAEVADGDERVRMPIAKGLALRLQRLAAQRLSGGEVSFSLQQQAEIADGDKRVWMPIANGLALPLQRLAGQQLGGGEVALGLQHRAEVANGDKRVRMPIAAGLALYLQRLAAQPLSLVELALGLQLRGERIQGGDFSLAMRPLDLEPCTQKLDAQRIAVLVHALAAAVGRVLPRARAPPLLEAVLVDPLGGAAAGARLDERAIVFVPPAQPARPLLHYHSGWRVNAPAQKDLVFAKRA